jgi:hypothetical protein
MALVGNLKDLKLPTLVQLNCMEKNTAKLTIDRAGKFGIIYFQGGQIVHAEFDPDIGEKALFRMLALEEGKFKVEGGVRPPARTIEAHWNNLLLEGLHQLDTIHAGGGICIRLSEMLMNVKGVNRCAFITFEGEPASEKFTNDEAFNLAALAYLEAQLITTAINRKDKGYVSILVGGIRILLYEYENNLAYMELDAKTQIETVIPFVRQVLEGDVEEDNEGTFRTDSGN